MEVSGQLYILVALDLGKEPQVPNEYNKGWASELKEKKKYLSSAGNQTKIIYPQLYHHTKNSILAPFTEHHKFYVITYLPI
jgi:hypothetical protein